MTKYFLKHLGLFFVILAIVIVGSWVRSFFHHSSFLVDLPFKLLYGIPYALGIPLLFLIADFRENVKIASTVKTNLWLVYRARYELDWNSSKIELLDEEFEDFFYRDIEIRTMKQIIDRRNK